MTETTTILRGRNLPVLAALDFDTALEVYRRMIGSKQLDAALRVEGLAERQFVTEGELRRVLDRLAGTALLSAVVNEVMVEVMA